jgi:hypothetical protein
MALDKQFCLKSQILVLYAKLQRIFPDFATAMIGWMVPVYGVQKGV